MCGRYRLVSSGDELTMTYDFVKNRLEFTSQQEIYPSNQAVIINKQDCAELVEWGFVLDGLSSRVINARAESLTERPMFRDAFNDGRCLIVASGFYEWKKTVLGKEKKLILVKDAPLFTMAGILVMDDKIPRFSLITKRSNQIMSAVHHRMPVILNPVESYRYLHGNQSEALSLIQRSDPQFIIESDSQNELLSLF